MDDGLRETKSNQPVLGGPYFGDTLLQFGFFELSNGGFRGYMLCRLNSREIRAPFGFTVKYEMGKLGKAVVVEHWPEGEGKGAKQLGASKFALTEGERSTRHGRV